MKKVMKYLGVGLLMSGSLWADHLLLPEAFNIIEVNGKRQGWSMFKKERKIDLEKGPYKILLQYEDFYDQGFDDHEKVKSKPIMITFQHEGGDLKTEFNRPEFVKIARLFAENPDLKIVDAKTGKRISMDLEILKRPNKGVTALKKETPQVKSYRAEDSKNIEAKPVTKSVASQVLPSKMKSKDPLAQLNHWWHKASLEQRQAFLKKVLK